MTPTRALLLALPTLLLAGGLAAQEDARGGSLVVTNARVAGHEGAVTIVVAGGKVRAVGRDARAPRGAPRLDAGGALVVPGRIDAWAGVSGADPLGRGVDGFDPHDRHALEDALSNGVTTVFLSPRGNGAGVLGAGSVVKLRPGAALKDVVVAEEAAVVTGVGELDAGPLARINAWGDLRRAFDAARRYRDAQADYDEALKKWAAEVGADAAPVDSRGGVAPVGSPSRAPTVAEPDPPRPRRRGPPRPEPAPTPPSAPQAQGAEPKKGERPRRPNPDRVAALLGRVLEGELPLRVRAQRAEDIVAALELAREQGVQHVIIEGGLEAHRVADLLAAREAKVVLGDPLPPGDRRARPPELAADLAGALQRRGVPFALGTGDLAASRFVELAAALAASRGLDRAAAEEAITARAADLLGLGDRLGRVAPGYDADLVILGRAPLATAPAAEVVIVDGHVAWRRAP
ncbi:MAG: amidohydrolase family protein [Planctomycetes bacterium]|nr:amidohydrolase family protein [Planctomycetota bacterium]